MFCFLIGWKAMSICAVSPVQNAVSLTNSHYYLSHDKWGTNYWMTTFLNPWFGSGKPNVEASFLVTPPAGTGQRRLLSCAPTTLQRAATSTTPFTPPPRPDPTCWITTPGRMGPPTVGSFALKSSGKLKKKKHLVDVVEQKDKSVSLSHLKGKKLRRLLIKLNSGYKLFCRNNYLNWRLELHILSLSHSELWTSFLDQL